jgi:hypothetical protein
MPGREGRVLAFYSYKGGCGRTMALANVAWILAANGRRVAVVDWDLESPGLHRYFPSNVLDPVALTGNPGVIDMVRDFEWAATHNQAPDPEQWYLQNNRIRDLAISLRWPFPGGGCIHFVSAGRQNRAYSAAVASLDWDKFYVDLGGGLLFDAMRRDMRENYDYTLIDSRTGYSDVADICTIHLPDVLVDCFTLNNQSIEGAAEVARSVQAHNSRRDIRILPVPMRGIMGGSPAVLLPLALHGLGGVGKTQLARPAAIDQPGQGARHHRQSTEMRGLGGDHQVGAGDALGQPQGVADRGVDVACAVPEEHRDGDAGGVETPAGDEGDRVVDPAAAGALHRLGEVGHHHGPDTGVRHHPAIGGRELAVPIGQMRSRIAPHQSRLRLEARDEGARPGLGGLVRGDVGGGHARIPVQALGIARSQADEHGGAAYAIAEQAGAGQRMRPPAGAPQDGETLQAERIGDRGHVLRRMRHHPRPEPIGVAVPGPVVSDEPHPEPVQHGPPGPRPEPAAGSAVHQEHGGAVSRPPLLDGQPAAVARQNDVRHRGTPSDTDYQGRRGYACWTACFASAFGEVRRRG